jgi:hypothetical protein
VRASADSDALRRPHHLGRGGGVTLVQPVHNLAVERSRRRMSPWWQMVYGMRAYGAAVTLVWGVSAFTLLAVLALALSGPAWVQATLGGAAVGELVFSLATFAALRRANQRGRFDV